MLVLACMCLQNIMYYNNLCNSNIDKGNKIAYQVKKRFVCIVSLVIPIRKKV